MIARKAPRRRGGIAIIAMVALVLILMLSGALLKVGLAERQTTRAEERRLQAEWLVESGLRRAAARLSADDAYKGETWKISPEDLGGPDPGLVTIAVEPAGEKSGRRALSVRAEYPAGATLTARQSKRIVIEAGEGEKSP